MPTCDLDFNVFGDRVEEREVLHIDPYKHQYLFPEMNENLGLWLFKLLK